MKVFIALLIIYLVYRLIRNLTLITFRRTPRDPGFYEPPEPEPPHQSKLISRDEGEYVDFEEMK